MIYLEPVGVFRTLLSGEDLDKAFVLVTSHVSGVGSGEMAVQRGGVELREDVDLVDVAVEAVADGDVDESVVSAERNSRFGSLLGEWIETSSGTTS